MKSDNSPPFNGRMLKAFMQENGIRHRKITPLWPQANALAEAFNKPLMKAIRSASIGGSSWRREMRKFLCAYRCTPHVTTEFTPHRLMFARDPQTKLPEVRQHVSVDDKVVRENDAAVKWKLKSHADKRTGARNATLNEGDVVLVRRQKTGKLSSTPFDPTPLVVASRKGSMITARRADGSRVTRNVSMFCSLPYEPPPLQSDVEGDVDDYSGTEATPPTADPDIPETPVEIPRRSSRVRKLPQRLLEYM